MQRWFGDMLQVFLTRLRPFEEAEARELIDSDDIMLCLYRDASQSGSVAEVLCSATRSLVTPSGVLAKQLSYDAGSRITAAATPMSCARHRLRPSLGLRELSTPSEPFSPRRPPDPRA